MGKRGMGEKEGGGRRTRLSIRSIGHHLVSSNPTLESALATAPFFGLPFLEGVRVRPLEVVGRSRTTSMVSRGSVVVGVAVAVAVGEGEGRSAA